MHTVRVASHSDLASIHRMQDVPIREFILNSPLAPKEQFIEAASIGMRKGQDYYFLHEVDDTAAGFIHLKKTAETCQPTVWGRWINTLVFATGMATFEHLLFPVLNWSVRAGNKAALRSYELFRFRKTGEGSVCNITPGFSFIALGRVVFYEVTAKEYFERKDWMKQNSLPVQFLW